MLLVNVVIPPLKSPLTYCVPEELAQIVEVGHQVQVPLGKKRVASGYVVETNPKGDPDSELKEIISISHSDPCFLPEQLEYFNWIAEYYCEPLSRVIELAIPPTVPVRYESYISLLDRSGTGLKGKTQQRIVDYLNSLDGEIKSTDLSRQIKGASQSLKTLEKLGVIGVTKRELTSSKQTKSTPWAPQDLELNQSQNIATDHILRAIENDNFEPILLYGITGSGKTEVYIEVIKKLMSKGLGALVIVPEIALTPQLIDRFSARLGTNIAVLHSALQKRTRWDSWRSLARGETNIAIGARSAIFAPVKNLKLIIVDEEHDGSYKQNEGIRYHARDLAIVRAKLASCPVVLGSATPSLESFENARKKKFTVLSLPSRPFSVSDFTVEIVDLTQLKPWQMPSRSVSPGLKGAITEVLKKDEQAFILYNRRGFAAYLQCDKCDAVLKCPNCSVTLTFHQFNNALVCHYCALSMTPPKICSSCTDEKTPGTYSLRGAGTESAEEELRGLFLEAKIERLDRDSVNDITTYENLLTRVRSGEVDILVGTQMIAKGHDLPNVTLAAVLDCDIGLHMPDFRASERVFQLLTQLSGRAGRGEKKGQVILQTRVPKHPSLTYTARRDFEGFATAELNARELLLYPPFVRLLRIVISSQDESSPARVARDLATVISKFFERSPEDVRVLGPAPAPLEKLKAEWRWHILIKSTKPASLLSIQKFLKSKVKPVKGIKIIYDLDPQEML